jgi:hypothetical protein
MTVLNCQEYFPQSGDLFRYLDARSRFFPTSGGLPFFVVVSGVDFASVAVRNAEVLASVGHAAAVAMLGASACGEIGR